MSLQNGQLFFLGMEALSLIFMKILMERFRPRVDHLKWCIEAFFTIPNLVLHVLLKLSCFETSNIIGPDLPSQTVQQIFPGIQESHISAVL